VQLEAKGREIDMATNFPSGTSSSTGVRRSDNATGAVSEAAESMNDRLKTVGVDTTVMAEAAREQAGQLQEMIAAEIKSRPFQALGLAALVGFWFGVRRR
jgi:ElaB/YqjD/DUF883 family membrane-anchored ribosome-binding protein